MQISFKAIIALLVVLLTACGGGSDDDKSPSLTSLQITGSESITVGMSESLHLKAHYSDGSEEDVTSATWSTSDSSLAAVNASGKVTAIAAGNVDISARYKGLEATQTIEVKAAQLVAMQILLEQESMPVGVTSQLKVIGSFNNNTSRELDLQVESSDVSIAGVDEVNVVTANSVGEVVLSAVQSGISAEQKLEVIEAQPLTAIVHAPMNIAKGTSNKAELFVSFTDGTTRPVQAKWQSESARVIQIDRAGMFTGFSHGESAISGAYENVLSNKVSITVTDALPVGIVVEPNSVSIPVGLTDKLSVLTLFSDNTQMIAEDAKFSDYDTQIIDIDSHGVITGLAKGATQVSVSAAGFSSQVDVVITDAIGQSIALFPDALSIPKGLSQDVKVFLNLSDDTQVDITDSAVIEVTPSELASVVEGKVTADELGKGTIDVKYLDFTAQGELSVIDAIPVSIGGLDNSISLPKGAEVSLLAYLEMSDGTEEALNTGVNWHVENDEIVSISNNGSLEVDLKGLAEGTTQVDINIPKYNLNSSINVTVTQAIPVALEVSDIQVYLDDDPVQAIAKLKYTDGTLVDVTKQIYWKSENTEVFTVEHSKGKSGLITPVTQGEASVFAVYGDNEFLAEAGVKVLQPRLLTGFEILHLHDESKVVIGDGEYQVVLKFTSAGSGKVYFYHDTNAGVGLSYGAYSISDIKDASNFSMISRSVVPEMNSDHSVALAKNHDDVYAVIQVHAVRDEQWYDNNMDVVMFSWAIRTDGGTDFTAYKDQDKAVLVKCNQRDFYGKGGCEQVDMPYSQSINETYDVDSNFTLASYNLISLGRERAVSNIDVKDRLNLSQPTLEWMNDLQDIPLNGSVEFKLRMTPTNNQTAEPFYQFMLDGNPEESFTVEGKVTTL